MGNSSVQKWHEENSGQTVDASWINAQFVEIFLYKNFQKFYYPKYENKK
jgi:hypothetical protein